MQEKSRWTPSCRCLRRTAATVLVWLLWSGMWQFHWEFDDFILFRFSILCVCHFFPFQCFWCCFSGEILLLCYQYSALLLLAEQGAYMFENNNNNEYLERLPAQALSAYSFFTNTYCQNSACTPWMHTCTHTHTQYHAAGHFELWACCSLLLLVWIFVESVKWLILFVCHCGILFLDHSFTLQCLYIGYHIGCRHYDYFLVVGVLQLQHTFTYSMSRDGNLHTVAWNDCFENL